MNKKRMRNLLSFGMALCLSFCFALPVFASAEAGAPLSPALSVLSGKTDLAFWSLAGETCHFSEDCFMRSLNLSKIDSIKVTKLPTPTSGILWLGREVLEVGKNLSASDLSRLTFEAASIQVEKASFAVEVNECGFAYSCNLFFLDTPNASPTLSEIPKLSRTLETHKNLSQSGSLYAKDPEGDAIVFEIVSYPKYGSLSLSGSRYMYTPFSNYTGEDSFSYVARDRYGNYSAASEISVSVSGMGANLVFADLQDPALCNAVMTLSSYGILGGEQVGNAVYFYPERAMTRAEFLVTAMSAAGITDLPDCLDTGFADDDEISDAMKPYIAAAYRLGYIKGRITEGKVCFLPNDRLTFGEAATLVHKLLLLDVPETSVAVSGSVNEDARQSVLALASAGMLSGEHEIDRANEILTRGEAAKLLCGIFSLCR